MPKGQAIRKRQKKTDVQGDFKCTFSGCGKAYLSYPALYTHIKQKHGEEHLEKMERPETKGNRGRPRRDDLATPQITEQPPIYLKIQIEAKQSIDDFLLELFETKKQIGNTIIQYKQLLQSEAEVISNEEIIKHIIEVFQYVQSKFYKTDQDNELTKELLNQILLKNETSCEIEDNLIKIGCDEAIFQFLKELSYTLNIKFLQSIAYFLFCFRVFAFKQHQCQSQTQPILFGEIMNDFMENNSEYFDNEIIKEFYQHTHNTETKPLLEQLGNELTKTIGLHFCNWLYSSRFTSQQLKLQ